MIALILNSGLGRRMGEYTAEHPKCMTELTNGETILSRQLKMLKEVGINDVVITTGYFNEVLIEYCKQLGLGMNFNFVYNAEYDKTNYIYSIYCARDVLKNQEIVMMHGDLVFELDVLKEIVSYDGSCMKVSSTLPLPQKDFKSVVEGGFVKKVGVEFFDNSMESQALYRLTEKSWRIWLDKICEYCEDNNRNCYAEVALNEISDLCDIYAYDVKDRLCSEIDTPEDWKNVLKILKRLKDG